MVRAAWVFFVCPYFLVAAALELLWLFLAVYANAVETYFISTAQGNKLVAQIKSRLAATDSNNPRQKHYRNLLKPDY